MAPEDGKKIIKLRNYSPEIQLRICKEIERYLVLKHAFAKYLNGAELSETEVIDVVDDILYTHFVEVEEVESVAKNELALVRARIGELEREIKGAPEASKSTEAKS